ncbi:hypothetical protein SB85_09265 [Xanthomonas sacchari]|nr:hypothetical protein SB85_09265 [Xanthomonas sacchari]
MRRLGDDARPSACRVRGAEVSRSAFLAAPRHGPLPRAVRFCCVSGGSAPASGVCGVVGIVIQRDREAVRFSMAQCVGMKFPPTVPPGDLPLAPCGATVVRGRRR